MKGSDLQSTWHRCILEFGFVEKLKTDRILLSEAGKLSLSMFLLALPAAQMLQDLRRDKTSRVASLNR